MAQAGKSGTIREPAREIVVTASCDVLVAGGGIAGVAAALAAARIGASVILVEKTCSLGGLATLGNVTYWLPLCDGRGRQVSGALAQELLELSVRDLKRDNSGARFIGIPECWKPGGDADARILTRFTAQFNPSSYLMALEELATKSGVRILYDTRVCALRQRAGLITHLVVENKSGRRAIACRSVVDATGDADICFLAGEETESLDSNVLCGWFYRLDDAGLKLETLTKSYSPLATRENAVGPFFRGDDAQDVTDQVLQSRALIRQRLLEMRHSDPERDIQLICPPSIPTFRMTRRLLGSFSLGEEHMHRSFEDTVGLTGDWRKPGPVYAFPLRSLCGVRNRNLLAAGRCASVDSSAWDLTRALPGCAVTGEAAGTAAALSVRESKCRVDELSFSTLRRQLESQGVLLDPALLAPA
jgi:hypothetical protein